MLGYVKAGEQELRVREQAYYRGLYCGLCHAMGRCTGQCSRMTLSYDFVFLATLRLSLTGEAVTMQKKRCIRHPFRARPVALSCNALNYCADASALLVYHKLLDDLCDEHGTKKLRARLIQPWLLGAYRRAKKRYPLLDATIAAHLQELAALEQQPDGAAGADAYAAIFGQLLGAVAGCGLDTTHARIATAVGRAVGHWIYLVDAADDFDEDRKRGRFNPFLQSFGDEPTAADWENLRLALTAHLCEAERGMLLIDSYSAPEQKAILGNILYLGMPAVGNAKARGPQHTDPDHSTLQ